MAFKVYRGKTKQEWYPVTVSTVLAKDTAVEWTSGFIAAADANDTFVAGVINKAIAATDSDYATARKVAVVVPMEPNVVWEADATGFTVGGTDEGVEYALSDAGTVDQTDTSNDVFLVTEVLSATKVRGYMRINGSY